MIPRDLSEKAIDAARQYPVVTITGPRQSGKTTLCRAVFADHPYVSLEVPDQRALATEDPRGFLGRYREGVVIDEVQRCPDILSYLQEIVDEDPTPGRWILTGSQNLLRMSSISQSLAGRASVLHLLPLTRNEIERFPTPPAGIDTSLLYGGYPRILDRGLRPLDFLDDYIATYLERDVRTLSNVGDLTTFQRFLGLCAGRTSELLNTSSLATDAGVSQPTAKRWLSILEASFLVFRLPAWHANIRKRLVKASKLHFYDSGLVCRLLGIRDVEQLANHPLRGSIFESWVMSEILKRRTHARIRGGMYHYRDRHGVEVDLVIESGADRHLIEAKSARTIQSDMARSLHAVSSVLGESVKAMTVVYGGETRQRRRGIDFVPWVEATISL